MLILLPAMALYPVSSIGASMLQVHDNFAIPAFAPVLFNAAILAGAALSYATGIGVSAGVYILAFAVFSGVVSWAGFIWLARPRSGRALIALVQRAKDKITFKRIVGDTAGISKMFLSYSAVLAATQCVQFVERMLASRMGAGSIAGLNYAWRLSQFPVWVFASAVTMITYPVMSKLKGAENLPELKEAFKKSLRTVLVVVAPLAAFIYVFRVPLVSVLFMHGAFDENSVAITADVLRGYSAAITGQSISAVCTRYFMATGCIRPVLAATGASGVINIAFNMLFAERLGAAAIGYGSAAGSVVNAVLMALVLQGKLKLFDRAELSRMVRFVSACAIYIAILFPINWFRGFLPHNDKFMLQAAYLFVSLLLGAAVYFHSLKKLKLCFANTLR